MGRALLAVGFGAVNPRVVAVSLINDMLKDLDKRQAGVKPARGVYPPAAKLSRPAMRVFCLGLLSVIALALISVFLVHIYQRYQTQLDKSAQEMQVLEQADRSSADGPEIPSAVSDNTALASIEQISIDNSEPGLLRLNLLFSRLPDYTLDSQEQRIRLQMPQSRLTGPLPNVAAIDEIAALKVVDEQGSLELVATLAQPAQVESYVFQKGEAWRLVLDIYPDKPQAVAVESLPPVQPQPAEAVVEEKPKAEAQSPAVFSKVPNEPSLAERDARTSAQAMELWQTGHNSQAFRLLLTFVSENPAAHRSRKILLTWLLAQNQVSSAQQHIAEGLKLKPDDPDYIKLAIRNAMAQQNWGEALQIGEAHLPLANEDTEFAALLASLYQRAEQHQQALALYRQLAQQQPQQAQWWVGQALSLEALQRQNEALATYRQAAQSEVLSARLADFIKQRIQALN